ncbi:MAG: fibronectin type III domain-containing protein, partial [Gemmatimonadetes bacterium]|nr:fibronectin type III domain-containing protein [Gemmatimonadota bacterium]
MVTGQARTEDTVTDPPAAPSGLNVTALSGTALRLDWVDESDDEDSFLLLASVNPLFQRGFYSTFELAPNQISFTHENLTPKTTYYYRLFARSDAGGSSAFVSAQGSTNDVQDPPVAAPDLSGPSSADGPFQLQWTYDWPSQEGVFIDRMVLEQSTTSATGGFSQIDHELRNLATHQFALQTGAGTFHYRIKAVMAFEGELISTPYSDVVSVNVTVSPKKIRIINDLYDQTDNLGNHWN